MSLTKEERRLLHQKSKQATFGTQPPQQHEGKDGDRTYRNLTGVGTVMYYKQGDNWVPMSSTDKMPVQRIISSGGGGGGSGVGGGTLAHGDLSGLNLDHHVAYIKADGTRELTADWDAGSFDITAEQFHSDIAIGTSPFTVTSSTKVSNLNADTADGYHFNQEVKIASTPTFGDLTISSPNNIYELSHDSFTDFVSNEHIDWTSTTENFLTTGTVKGGTATFTTTNDEKLRISEDSSNYVTFNVSNDGQLNIYPTGTQVSIQNQKSFGSSTSDSGFAGNGWRIDYDSSSQEYSAEFDNLIVRGTMSVYELLIQQIRATNGSLIVASADKVVAAENLSGGASGLYKLTVEADDTNNFIHFKDGDLILAQKWTGGSGSDDGLVTYIKRVRATVTETSNSGGSSLEDNEFKAELEGADEIASTDLPLDFVRIGSTSDEDRQGGIYITSEDSGAPFIDIFNEVDSWADWRDVDKTKARLGKLTGITYDSVALSGYGLFSENVYLTGKITATSGYIGGSNGWTIADSKLFSTYASKTIGLVQQGEAHADVGSVSSFYAGASADTGEDATISFGSDGKIRGTGVYIRSEGGTTKEWCIEQSRMFGDGADGTIKVRYHSSTGYKMSMDGAGYQVYYDSNGPTSPAYEDKPFQVENGPSDSSILDVAIHLKRDLYLEKLEIDFDEPGGGDIEIQTNGFRLFVRDKIEFIGDDLDSYHRYLHIINRGEDASDCSAGSNGGVSSGNMSYVNGSDGTGGGRGGASGTLIGGKGGKDGGDGGDGGGVQTVDGELTAVSGTADTYNDGVDGDDWGAGVDTLEGINGKAGGRGGAGQPGSANAGAGVGGSNSSGASGGDSTNATTKIQSLDPHLVTTFRDIYSDSDTSKRVAPTVGSGSGGAGGGGGGGYASLDSISMQGGGGGGGGGSGGSGGIVMVCVRVVEDNSTNGSVFLKLDASGGDAGNGGNGGLRGEYTSGGGGV